MTTPQLVNELKTYGYDLYLEGENLRYKFHSLVEPPKERIVVLLDNLKRNKPEVISYLRANEGQNKPLSPNKTSLGENVQSKATVLPDTGFVRLSQILGDKDKGIPPIIPISRSTWWAGVKTGRFPKPVKFSARITCWRTEDIRALIAAQPGQQ